MEKTEKKTRFRKRRYGKRSFLLFSLLAFLVVGIYRDYRLGDTIAAEAVPLGLIGSAVFTLTLVMGGEAAGETMSDILSPNPWILDEEKYELTEEYVRKNFPEKIWSAEIKDPITDVYDKFVDSMTTYFVNTQYIIREEFCKKLWDNLPLSGSSALKPEDVVTTDQNVSILLAYLLTRLPDPDDMEKRRAVVLKEIFNEEENSLAPNIIAGIFTTKFFRVVYETLIRLNGTDQEEKLEGNSEQGCDYTLGYYQSSYNTNILTMGGVDTFEENGYTAHSDYIMNFTNLVTINDDIHKQIFPLTFDIKGVPQLGFASSLKLKELTRKGEFFCVKTYDHGGGASSSDYFTISHKKYAPLFAPFYYAYSTGSLPSFLQVFPSYFPNKTLEEFYQDFNLRESQDNNIQDVLIDVGTLENFEKFCDLVETGEYTLAELLNLMERGWVVQIKNKEKQWEGIKNNGKTAKETLDDPEKGEKYKTATGKVSLESLKKGTEKQTIIKHGQPLYEFLGDPTTGTELEVNPSPGTSSETSTNPQIVIDPGFTGLPDTWWGVGYNPVNAPGASTSPGTNPGTDSGTNPGTDPGTDPGTNPGTNPGTDSGDGGNNGDDPEGKKPFTPGFSGDPDDPDNVQWYERFPFSIPWDIGRLIEFFSAEKEAPVFVIPADFNAVGVKVKEDVKIDLKQFSDCIKVIRVFILLAYVSGLVIVTRKIIKG